MKKNLIAALMLSVIATASYAKPEGWHCIVNDLSDYGFMPTQMVNVADANAKSATVADEYSMTFNGVPSKAKLKVKKGNKWRLSWRVRNIPTSNAGNVTVSYQAEFDRAAQTVVVRGRLANAQNTINGSGACKTIDPSILSNG